MRTTVLLSLAAVLAAGAARPAAACVPPAPGLVVSPAGDDDQDGSAERPLRTPARALAALRTGLARTIYLDGGVYALTSPLTVRPGDDGVALRACPGQSPALDGGAAGLETLIDVADVAGVVVSGLTLAHAAGPALVVRGGSRALIEHNLFTDDGGGILLVAGFGQVACANRILHVAASGIEAKDGVEQVVIAHNDIDGAAAPTTHGGGIFLHGSTGATIARNRVRNTAGMGIGVANWDGDTVNRATVITGNLVQNANRTAEDSGAIYVLGRSHVDQASRIAGNVIEDAGAPGDAHTIGIYLDDSTSGVVVEHNIIRRPGTHAIQVHGGDDVLIRNNFIDLDHAASSAVLFQAAPADTAPTNTMLGNRVLQNLIRLHGPARSLYTFIEGGTPLIAENLIVHSSDAATAGLVGSDRLAIVPDPVDDEKVSDLASQLIGFSKFDLAVGPDTKVDCSTLN